MGVYERIYNLCKERGISVTALEKELGFGRGSIGKLKGVSKSTSSERINKIADYFDVYAEFLLRGENPSEYYLDRETAERAQAMKDNDQLRLLFDTARDSKPEDIQTAYDVLLALKRKETHSEDD